MNVFYLTISITICFEKSKVFFVVRQGQYPYIPRTLTSPALMDSLW